MCYRRIIYCVVFSALLSACSGGDSDSSVSFSFNSTNGGVLRFSNCDTPATTFDRFLITSYQSCDARDDDLTGVWIIVSDYSITTNFSQRIRRSKRQRNLMIISQATGGNLSALICNPGGTRQQTIFSPNSATLSVFDEIANASLSFSIVNNVMLMGAHASGAQTFVERSSAFAIKLQNLSENPLGTATVITDNSTDTFSPNCLAEDSGSVEILSTIPATSSLADTISVFSVANSNGGFNSFGDSDDFAFTLSVPTSTDADQIASLTTRRLSVLDMGFDVNSRVNANTNTSLQVRTTLQNRNNTSSGFRNRVDSSVTVNTSFVLFTSN